MFRNDLQTLILRLEEAGELHRVPVEVDPSLEVSEITNRMCKVPGGGRALLFTKVTGSPFPVATNLFGSPRRLCLALGIDRLDDLSLRMEQLLATAAAEFPEGVPTEKLLLLGLKPFSPRTVPGAGPEIVDRRHDLTELPALQNWPGDGRPASGGRFLTLPLVVTADPEDGTLNVGLYRVEVLDGTRVAIHWRDSSGGAGHYRKQCSRGGPMPVSIVLGGDPALTFAASVPLPEGVAEVNLAGFLQGAPLEMVKGRLNDLLVPADAEMVLEGIIHPGEVTRGGDFGNHTGFYSSGGMVPVVQIMSMSRRDGCILPATVVGPPPMEDCFLAKATERLLLPVTRRDNPEVVDICLPLEGIFHGCAVVSIAKTFPGQAREVMAKLWGGGWLWQSRLLLMVDAHVPPENLSLVAWKMINNVDWGRDLVIHHAAPGGPAAVGIDATVKLPGEAVGSVPAEALVMSEEIRERVDRRWRDYGFA